MTTNLQGEYTYDAFDPLEDDNTLEEELERPNLDAKILYRRYGHISYYSLVRTVNKVYRAY